MKQHIAHIALVVDDYDEAITFYTQKLRFTLVEDTALSETKRWVLVAPKGSSECRLLLAKAANEEQHLAVGNQSGGRVFLFLHTDDFWRDYHDMLKAGIIFVRNPSVEPYGIVAVFKDLCGNLWDLIEPTKRNQHNCRMLRPIDNYFLQPEEPVKSCLQFLREYILNMDDDITEKWSYGMPFYYYKGKRFCFLWVNKKPAKPYIGIVDGNKIDHPGLEAGNRRRMKIFLIEPRKNIPLGKINGLMKKVLALYK